MEFQKEFPDGIVLRIVDKRNTRFQNDASFKPFSGKGDTVGWSTTNSKVSSFAEMGNPQLRMNTTTFLNALPASVISNTGQVISIRNDISNKLGINAANGNKPVLVETDALEYLKTTSSSENISPTKRRNITTLQIKLGRGQATLILKMFYDDTVQQVHNYVDTYR